MKLKVLVVSLVAFFAIVGSASAHLRPPTITEAEAEKDTLKFLHESYGAWRYRTEGYVDCRNGRINRYIWVCRAGWRKGEICTQGRLRIENEEVLEGSLYYYVRWRGRPC